MHISVLQEPILAFFRSKKLRVFVDATLGGCGHSMALCREHPELEYLIGFDQDETAIECAKKQLFAPKTCFFHCNFRFLKEKINEQGFQQVDGILVDLGVSSMQLDSADRGFSFQQDGPLDMRMDRSASFSAEEIVNEWSEKELAQLFFEFGQERHSRRAARAIVQQRRKSRIDTTAKLVATLSPVLGYVGGIHPATRIFQALRLAVNEELEVLQELIPQAVSCLAPEGLLAIISFHSLEDRIVKQAFRQMNECEILTKKPIIPTLQECRENRRARSAKLRVLQKKSKLMVK